MTLLVVVPSRGRPRNIAALADAWTASQAAADVIVAVDDDDPTRGEYFDVVATHPRFDLAIGPRGAGGMVTSLNRVAVANAERYDAIGFCGDDHRPRTPRWDETVDALLYGLDFGIAYCNDLIQGERLPTAAFMTSNIIRTLGWMAPPRLRHLFVDNAWRSLGCALEQFHYLPDVIIEHVHPVAGKVDWDDGYREVNAGGIWEHDQAEFHRWLSDECENDARKIRTAVPVG